MLDAFRNITGTNSKLVKSRPTSSSCSSPARAKRRGAISTMLTALTTRSAKAHAAVKVA